MERLPLNLSPEDQEAFEEMMSAAADRVPPIAPDNEATEHVRIQLVSQILFADVKQRTLAGDPLAGRIWDAMVETSLIVEVDAEIAENGPIYTTNEGVRRVKNRLLKRSSVQHQA